MAASNPKTAAAFSANRLRVGIGSKYRLAEVVPSTTPRSVSDLAIFARDLTTPTKGSDADRNHH